MAISSTDDPATESWESVAYFSMEIGLEESIPTYSGGLGVLAGDTVRSAADMTVPLVGVSLVHRKGYFRQRLDPAGHQTEEPVDWPVAERLVSLEPRVTVEIERRSVQLRAWRYEVRGISGHVVPAYGHDFDERAREFCVDDVLNMTQLALDHSHYVNGVAKRHGEVARQMFAHRMIDSITNGVHAATWAASAVQIMLDRHIPDWRQDNASLRHVLGIPKLELWEAHTSAKQDLIKCVNEATGAAMDPKVFTIGFARRVT